MNKLCECGCGKLIKSDKRFCSGHNKAHKDKKHSKESREKISLGTKIGMRRSKKKIGRPTTRILIESVCNNCSNKISDYTKRIFCSRQCAAEYRKKVHYKHSKQTIEKIRKARFEQKVPIKGTLPENIIEDILLKNDVKFRKQWNIDYKIIADFYVPKSKTAIFADGDFWHCSPNFRKKYNDGDIVHHGKTKKQIVDKDLNDTQYLISKGYKVLRFWECDLKNNRKAVETAIEKELVDDSRNSEVVSVS